MRQRKKVQEVPRRLAKVSDTVLMPSASWIRRVTSLHHRWSASKGGRPSSSNDAPGIKTVSDTFAIICFFAAQSAFAANAPLDLHGTMEYALRESPTVDSARRSAEISELTYRSAQATLFPSLDLSANHGLSDSIHPPSGNSPWSSYLGLSLTENLYNNGRSFTQIATAGKARELADIQYRQTRDQTLLSVLRAYYHYSETVLLQQLSEERRNILKTRTQQVSHEYEQGLATRRDFLRFNTQLQRTDIDLTTAKNSVLQAKSDLWKLIGVPTETTPELLPDFRPLTIEETAILEKNTGIEALPSLQSTYEFRASEIQDSVNRESINLAQRLYWPNIDLSANANYGLSNYLGANANSSTGGSWNVALNFTYNLWDGGRLSRGVAIARQSAEIQANSLRETVHGTRSTLQNLNTSRDQLLANYKLSRELLKMDERSYALIERDYKSGSAGFLDLINALNDLLSSRQTFFSSHFSLLSTLAQIRYYEGRLANDWISNPESR